MCVHLLVFVLVVIRAKVVEVLPQPAFLALRGLGLFSEHMLCGRVCNTIV